MPKSSSKPKSFEDSYAELESIVRKIQSEQLPLEELISLYERAKQLILDCRNSLSAANLKLETLSQGKDTNLEN